MDEKQAVIPRSEADADRQATKGLPPGVTTSSDNTSASTFTIAGGTVNHPSRLGVAERQREREERNRENAQANIEREHELIEREAALRAAELHLHDRGHDDGDEHPRRKLIKRKPADISDKVAWGAFASFFVAGLLQFIDETYGIHAPQGADIYLTGVIVALAGSVTAYLKKDRA